MRFSRSNFIAFLISSLAIASTATTDTVEAGQKDEDQQLLIVGTIRFPQVSIIAGTSGSVMRVNHEEGDRVKTGDVLAEVEDREGEAELKLAEAELGLAVAAQKEFAATNGGNIDKSPAREKLVRLAAQVRVAEARVGLQKVRADARIIRSPIDGVISSRHVDRGSHVRNSESEMFTVNDLSRPELEVSVPERNIRFVKLKQPCSLIVDAFPDIEFKGVVSRIQPIIRKETRTIQVFVSVRPPKGKDQEGIQLLPGMTAQVRFDKGNQ